MEALLADLLIDTIKAVLFFGIGIVTFYIMVRIGTMAVLRSIYDFRKQVAKEG